MKNNKGRKIFLSLILVIIIIFFFSTAAAADAFENKRISINFRELDLKEAVIIMADMADQNLICDQSVKGQLTVILEDILFKDAFQLIAESYNLDYLREKNTIFVSAENIKKDEKSEMIVKNLKFNYIDAEKAEKHLINAFPDLEIMNLAAEGLLIKAENEKLEEVEALAEKLDLPQKQVLIQARLEEISRTKLKELGINPDNLSRLNIIKDSSENIEKIEFTWPETLKMLEEEGASEILANPSLLTLDREKAKLIIGDQIPVKLERIEDDKTVSSLSYIDAGIVLEFLPRIINNNQVLLKIKPSVNSIGQVISNGLPAVNSRSAETTVILEEGEMLALGGLIKEDKIRSLRKLPIISELPLLGKFFRSEENRKLQTELMIFIKTKIITASAEAELNIIQKKGENNIEKNREFSQAENKGNENTDKDFINLTDEELENILNK
ncbi:MAG: type II secretion system protein GspD [Halanaerobium sp.]